MFLQGIKLFRKIPEYLSLRTLEDLIFETYFRTIKLNEKSLRKNYLQEANKKFESIIIKWPIEYQWGPAKIWVTHILEGFKRLVRIKFKKIQQTYQGIVKLKVIYKGKEIQVAVDYSDHAERIDYDCLKDCELYFKMQYLRSGYNDPKIIPGFFIPGNFSIYYFLPYLRRRKNCKKKNEVYGRFGKKYSKEIRKNAVEILTKQSKFKFEGDLKKMRYSRYLREVAMSKICIDLPGNGDFCFRLVDYMAIGVCIIGPKHKNTFEPPLEDRKNIVYCKDDLSDLVDLCSYYLSNDEEREEIATNSMKYFDNHLHFYKLSYYYLLNIIEYFEVKHLEKISCVIDPKYYKI